MKKNKTMNAMNRKQLQLPFPPQNETRLERVERLLGGKLRGKVRPASELQFNYEEATSIATKQAKND